MHIAIIGAGPCGIAAGRELRRQGFTDFTIIDALDAPGGTWRLHNYPGLACDVWAHSYSFTYAPNPNWSASFVEQSEIQAYLADCAREFGLEEHLKLNTRILRAQWQTEGHWILETEAGESLRADVIINAMGNQHTPLYPDVPGRDSFTGDSWHGTRWDHSVSLEGKRIAVVGSAACAVQVVPEVAKVAGKLTVLQRSPNWIMPRGRKFYSEAQKRRYRRYPWLIKAKRAVQGLMMGQVENAATLGHKRMQQFEKMALDYLHKEIHDPELRAALTPDSRYGCKRGLVSDDFYPALKRDNVSLIAEGLKEVTPTGIVTSSGEIIDCDVIIYCTGYRIMDWDRIDVRGRDNQSLAQALDGTPRAYKGIATPGFPNYFFAMGPNGLVLNASYFRTAEVNVASIVKLLRAMRDKNSDVIEVKETVTAEYCDWMMSRFPQYSWAAKDCQSYYTNAEGYPPFLYPGSFKAYQKAHGDISLDEFETERTEEQRQVA
ncbi:MAG: NAD(P)/FAD-dependent oxidoreductase [Halieaceae bacterium]|nr:NAD(P)/FAD-dependent oxidoreductase [Halieaceae bacterium]